MKRRFHLLAVVMAVGAILGEQGLVAQGAPALVPPEEINSRFWPPGYRDHQGDRDVYDLAAFLRTEKLFPKQLDRGYDQPWIQVAIRCWLYPTPGAARSEASRYAAQAEDYEISSTPGIPGGVLAFRERARSVDYHFEQDLIFSVGRLLVDLNIDGHDVAVSLDPRMTRPAPTSKQLRTEGELWIAALRHFGEARGWLGGSSVARPGSQPVRRHPIEETPTPLPPDWVKTAAGILATGGVAALGALLAMLGSGVKPSDVVEGVREILGGSTEPAVPAPPPGADLEFENWKRDYESRGWRYTEKDGIAEFEPVEGAVNEGGWVYSEEQGGFVQREDQRPRADVPAANVRYREEVRLLQEDFERQRDLLDRERERLRNYQQSGLDELVPGARERIRQYERLADLNENELKRLDEDRPAHTGEDNRDVEADAGERLRTRETIRELNESEERSDAIQDRADAESAREAATREAEELVARNLDRLKGKMQAIIDEKTREGYFVRNSTLPEKAWNNSLGRAIEWAGGWKGGQCGEFGEWGIKWTKDAIGELFGPDAIVTDIAADTNPLVSHRATKVILPDGQRLVLDYWESMPDGKPSISSEKDWIARWEKKLFAEYLGKGVVVQHGDQVLLKDQIEALGEEDGIENFRRLCRKKKPEYAEIFIRSWKKSQW